MFKAVAEYVMRGRIQAVAIALLGSWLPFVPQAVIGLVTLRKGWQEGLIVTLWASLPALIGLWVGEVSTPMTLASVAVFFIGFIAGCVLRQVVSWPITLVASVACSAFAALLIVIIDNSVADEVAAFFTKVMTGPDGSIPEEAKPFIESWNVTSASGLVAYWLGISSIVGLLIARWLQSLLFHPEGFKQEFHAMRTPMRIALISGIAAVYCLFAGEQYQFWGGLFGLPLLFAGLGLAHWLISRYKMGAAACVALYIAIPILPAGALAVMLLALFDAGVDLRNKLRTDRAQ